MRKIDYYCRERIKAKKPFRKTFNQFECDGDTGSFRIWGNLIADIDYTERRITFCKCGYDTMTTQNRLNAIAQGVLGKPCDVFFQIRERVLEMYFQDDEHFPCNHCELFPVDSADDMTWYVEFRERW